MSPTWGRGASMVKKADKGSYSQLEGQVTLYQGEKPLPKTRCLREVCIYQGRRLVSQQRADAGAGSSAETGAGTLC